jgi:hypothetical protein
MVLPCCFMLCRRQKLNLMKAQHFSKTNYYLIFQHPLSSGASVAPTTQVCKATMFKWLTWDWLPHHDNVPTCTSLSVQWPRTKLLLSLTPLFFVHCSLHFLFSELNLKFQRKEVHRYSGDSAKFSAVTSWCYKRSVSDVLLMMAEQLHSVH